MFEVIIAIFLNNEIVQVHQKIGCGAGAAQHARNNENHVDKTAAKRFQIGWRGGVSSDLRSAFQQPGGHGNAGTIRG